jgi:branched-chain amino acid transport system substrate-binding protein
VQSLIEAGGAETVYGGKDEGNEFPVDQSAFASEVTALKASGAEAIVIITFDQVESIVPELQAQGLDLSKVYLVDGSLKNFATLEPGLLAGAQGTKPGFEVDATFLDQLKAAYSEKYGSDLEDLTYAPEAYDLVNIVALAAEKAGSADAASMQKQLAAVTGANGGEECTSFAECRDLIADGKDIHYVTRAGVGPLNANNDPSTAWIGVYKYGADNNEPVFVRSEEGEIK